VRIISGKYKGKTLQAPKQLPVRPTTDYAKEGLFNIIENSFDMDELSVLDLFCGTGNISFEFASRGAKNITSVDANNHCVRFVKETSNSLELKNLQIIKQDVFRFLQRATQQFDLIFADPPYQLKEVIEIPDLIFKNNWLKEEGWFILEHDKFVNFISHPNFFQQRKYGNVNFSFFQHL
jgi:16S rRNA (guanine(966)-N(2))-methyltransferase RsmD